MASIIAEEVAMLFKAPGKPFIGPCINRACQIYQLILTYIADMCFSTHKCCWFALVASLSRSIVLQAVDRHISSQSPDFTGALARRRSGDRGAGVAVNARVRRSRRGDSSNGAGGGGHSAGAAIAAWGRRSWCRGQSRRGATISVRRRRSRRRGG